MGPMMVPVQLRRFSGEEGKAEMPGVEESISCMSSVCRLEEYQYWCSGLAEARHDARTGRSPTAW